MLRDTVSGKNTDTQCGDKSTEHAEAAMSDPELPTNIRAVSRSTRSLIVIDVGAACTGTCKWFDSSKGFGFIAVDGEESDIFVHQSEIYSPGFRSLADGEKVEFKVSADDRTGVHQSTHSCRLSPVISCAPPRAAARHPYIPRRARRPPMHRPKLSHPSLTRRVHLLAQAS